MVFDTRTRSQSLSGQSSSANPVAVNRTTSFKHSWLTESRGNKRRLSKHNQELKRLEENNEENPEMKVEMKSTRDYTQADGSNDMSE